MRKKKKGTREVINLKVAHLGIYLERVKEVVRDRTHLNRNKPTKIRGDNF